MSDVWATRRRSQNLRCWNYGRGGDDDDATTQGRRGCNQSGRRIPDRGLLACSEVEEYPEGRPLEAVYRCRAAADLADSSHVIHYVLMEVAGSFVAVEAVGSMALDQLDALYKDCRRSSYRSSWLN